MIVIIFSEVLATYECVVDISSRKFSHTFSIPFKGKNYDFSIHRFVFVSSLPSPKESHRIRRPGFFGSTKRVYSSSMSYIYEICLFFIGE